MRARRTQPRTATAANRERIRRLASDAPTDLEALARLFDDDGIADDGTVSGRLRAVLDATERRSIPGLHTGLPFSDTGFAGSRQPGGPGFRDPWPTSRNQVGHFLTAVAMRYAPEFVSRRIPVFGSVRRLVGAPSDMSDAEVALRLAIGHEKLADPPDVWEALLLVLADGLVAARWSLVRDTTRPQRAGRIGRAMVLAAARQLLVSLVTFRAQFKATTESDIAAWYEALQCATDGVHIDRALLESPRSPLRHIMVGRGIGNSEQDLRLSLAGWRLGQLIAEQAFASRHEVADWLRRTLG
ncbi:MAG TPA: hypothetical protein VFE42_14555 [Chloroflexota bacterium]|nr:hypothetical protein [Chloroflexota bacterium]